MPAQMSAPAGSGQTTALHRPQVRPLAVLTEATSTGGRTLSCTLLLTLLPSLGLFSFQSSRRFLFDRPNTVTAGRCEAAILVLIWRRAGAAMRHATGKGEKGPFVSLGIRGG